MSGTMARERRRLDSVGDGPVVDPYGSRRTAKLLGEHERAGGVVKALGNTTFEKDSQAEKAAERDRWSRHVYSDDSKDPARGCCQLPQENWGPLNSRGKGRADLDPSGRG